MRSLKSWVGAVLFVLAASAAAAPLKVVVNGKEMDIPQDQIGKMKSYVVSLKEHDGTVLACKGALVADVLSQAGLTLGDHVKGKALATYVLIKASDGYQVVFGLGELEPSISGRNIVLAYEANDQPLIPSVGPWRIVAEGDKKQARSIRMVTEIDVVQLASG